MSRPKDSKETERGPSPPAGMERSLLVLKSGFPFPFDVEHSFRLAGHHGFWLFMEETVPIIQL